MDCYIESVAKRVSTEDALAAIHALRQSPDGCDPQRDLAPFLQHKSNHVVAAAANTAERMQATALAPDLVAAFERLMRDPAKLDQGCKATSAIVQALIAIEDPAARVFFAGIRHVQKEGSFGPPVDVAAPLRGLCARGLARMGHPDALQECVTLLVDPDIPARAGAIRAVADAGRPEGVLLLRLKVLLGDKEPEITAECFAALLSLDPEPSVGFVAKFLDPKFDELAEQAALALSESRRPAAFDALRAGWEQGGLGDHRRMLLRAIGMMRSESAVEFLIERLGAESPSVAADALDALAFHARDETVLSRVERIISERAEPILHQAFARDFRK